MEMTQRGLLPLVIFVFVCVNAAHGFTGELENPYSAKDFVTKLPSKGEVGPAGMAFVGDYLYVLDHSSSCLYRFSAAHGGSADGNSRNALNCYDKTPGGVGYTGISTDASAQRLFISQQQPGSVFEVDPENGQIIDTIASDVPGVSSLAADQVYGDLYAVQSSGAEEDTVFRFRFRSIPKNAKAIKKQAIKKQAKLKAKAALITAKSLNQTSAASAVKSTKKALKKALKKASKKLKRKAKKNGKQKKKTRRSKRSILRRKRTQAKRQRKRRAAMRRKARARAYADSNQAAAEADASRWKNKVVVKRIYSRVKLQAGKKVLTSAPDGTLYVASSDAIISIPMSRRKLAPNYRIISGLGDVAGITVSADKRRLLVNHHSGKITEVNLTNMTTKAILRKGTRGDCIAFGPDGCIYASQTDEILRISTQPDGSCAGDFGPNPEAYRRSMVHWINEQGVKMQTEQSNKNRRRKQLAREEMRKNNEMDRKQLEIQRRKDLFNEKQSLLDEQQVKLDRKEEKLQERADEEEFKLDMKAKQKADAVKNQLKQIKQKKPQKQVKLTPVPKPAPKVDSQREEQAKHEEQNKRRMEERSKSRSEAQRKHELEQKRQAEQKSKGDSEQKGKADAIAQKNLAEEKRRLMICSTNPCKRDTDVCSTSAVAPYYNCTHACASFDLKQCLDTHRCRARHHAGSCAHACTGYDGCERHSWTGLCVGEEHKPRCANPCTAGGDRSGENVCKEFGLSCVADRYALVKYRCVKCPRHMAGKECNRLKQMMVANLATGANGPSITRLISSASAPGTVTGTKLAVPGLSVPAVSLDSFKSNGDIVFTTGALNMVYKASRDGDGYSTPTPFARLGVEGFAHGIAVGPDNTVYVTSRSTDRIFHLSEKGAILNSVSTNGVCSRPAGIILSPKKTRLFVACSAAETLDPKPRVVMYTLNLRHSKKFVTHKLLTSPGGFAFDSDKNLYISNLLPINGNSTLIRVAAPSRTMLAGVPSPGKHIKSSNSNSTKGRKVTVFARTNEGVGSDVGVDANDNVYWTVKSSSPSVENFVLQFAPNYKKKVGGKPQSGTKISLGNVFVPSGVKLV